MLADRVSATLARRSETRYSADTWLSDYLLPAMDQFGYGGAQYPFGLNLSQSGVQIHEISQTLPGYSAALRNCPPAFAAQLVRALVISQARFTFRNRPSSRTPRRTFGTSALGPLEQPWPKATTGELLARMEWHAGLAGNAFVTNHTPGRLRVLRPDWVVIVYGSQQEPEQAAYALDGEVVGYVYAIGGLSAAGGMLAPLGGGRMYTLLPEEVAHWSPVPDPEASGIGMSWITPAVRDMQSDRAATEHKLRFWSNGATPNLVVKGLTATTKTQFDEMVEMMEARHAGLGNAYRTLYLTAGADATVVGSNFKDMDLKNIQGASETRISSLSRVPASLLGIAEGLAGSSLNAGNFGMARRIFADTWVYPSLQDLAASLAPMVRVPPDAELWFDVADMPLLREDGKDAAEIEQIKATTITQYVREGFTAESAIAAVRGQDVSLLVHTNLVSVQLQKPGTTPTASDAPAQGGGGEPVPFSGARSDEVDALIEALAEFESRSAFNAAEHPRNPKGSPGGGRFRSLVDRVLGALDAWSKGDGPDDPFDGFNREQLRQVAKHRGIPLRRGADIDEIKKALKADLKVKVRDAKAAKSPEVGKPVRFTLTGGKVDPAKAREVEVENKIRAAYRNLRPNAKYGSGSEWLGLADLRDELGESVSRHETDAALRRMAKTHNDPNAADAVRVIPIANSKALKPRDREAAFQIGDSDVHMVSFADPSPRPVPDSKLRDLDVGVFTEHDGKVSIWEVSDSGVRRRRIAQADDLAGLEQWAKDNGESEVADWARKERGGEAPKAPAKPRATTVVVGPTPVPKAFPPGQHSWSGHDGIDVTDEEEASFLSQPLTKQAEIQGRIKSGSAQMGAGQRGRYFGSHPDPDVVVSPEREAEIRAAVEQVVRQRGSRLGGKTGVALDVLREGLAGRFDRAEVDNVIQKLNRSTDWYVVAEANQKVLTPRARLAAVVIGGQDKHRLVINTFGPVPADRVPEASPDVPAKATKAAASPMAERAALDAVPVHISTRAIGGRTDDVRGLDGMTPRQRDTVTAAVDAYRGLGHEGINRYLRSGEQVRGAKSAVTGIDKAMDASPLPSPIVVYRGVGSGESTFGPRTDWPDDLTGFEWTDAGYPSTTASREIAAAAGGPVQLRIVAPEGTKAVKLSEFEQEILLQRGLTFRVVRDNGPEEIVDGFGNRHRADRVLDVEIVPSPATKAAKKAAPAAATKPVDLDHLRTLDRETARDELDLRKIDDLKTLLREQGLPVSGRKRDLVDRLVEHTHGGGTATMPTEKAARAVKVGTRVKLKPSAGSYATSGTIRDIQGSGADATYLVDAYDAEGRHTLLFIPRSQFTLARSVAAAEGDRRSLDDLDDTEDPTLDEIQAMARAQLDHDELRLRGIVAERAAGHDVTPGHDELHHWWVYGEGRARWETWTELYDQLAKIPEVGPVKAKVYASAWFKERHGYASGSDINRVRHGKPPRGKRVGPG